MNLKTGDKLQQSILQEKIRGTTEIIIVTTDNKKNNQVKPSLTLHISHQYLLVYKKIEK